MLGSCERYLARLCWNSNNWTRPSGDADEQEDTYSSRVGFGHEEWLFNFEWVLDGWKYGFLQPVNRSLEKVQGRVLDIRLYTIRPDSAWFYVGHIPRCEVLTEDQAEGFGKQFKRNGWLKEMIRHVEHVGGNARRTLYEEWTGSVNVRFRPSDAELYDPIIPVGEKDAIRKLRRYTLVEVRDDIVKVEKQWATRVAAAKGRTPGKAFRDGDVPRDTDPIREQLQGDLYTLLTARFGRAVSMEEGAADIELRRDNTLTLIEVASDSRPRHAVRGALGLLMEYALRCEAKGDSVAELVVVGPGEVGDGDRAYLDHLRVRRGLPVRYVCFRRGMDTVDI